MLQVQKKGALIAYARPRRTLSGESDSRCRKTSRLALRRLEDRMPAQPWCVPVRSQNVAVAARRRRRPQQVPGKAIVPIFHADRGMQLLEFDHDDPKLDRSDPRVYRYDGVDYLTTISHLRPVCSEDGIHFREQDAIPPLIGEGPFESYGIEDCRVAQIGEDYYLTYTAVSREWGGRGAAQHAGLAGGQ